MNRSPLLSLRPLAVVALAFFAGGCSTELEVAFNVEVVDFGSSDWVDGAPTETEAVFLVNDGQAEVYVHALTIEGEHAGSWTAEPVRATEFPYVVQPAVGSEIAISFQGVPDNAVEDFSVTLVADLSPTAANRSRFTAQVGVPITLFLSCDADEDGDPTALCGGADCDDEDGTRSTLLPELCNGLDDDCNDLADADPAGEVDSDFDSFRSCDDCDETDPFTYPGAPERCDGEDNDCNGLADEDEAGEVDADGDGWLSCEDCDDNDSVVGPFGCD